jgi:hypothetical protein
MKKIQKIFSLILIIFISFQIQSIQINAIESLRIGTVLDTTEFKMSPGQTKTLDFYIFNIGDKDVKIETIVHNTKDIFLSTVPSQFGLPKSSKTITPTTEKNIYWWVMQDGYNYIPAKKITLYITISDTLLTRTHQRIYNPIIQINANALIKLDSGIKQNINFIREVPLTIEITDAIYEKTTLYNKENINLKYTENETKIIQSNQKTKQTTNTETSQQEQTTETNYGPIIKIETKEIIEKNQTTEPKNQTKKPWTTIYLLLFGFILLYYLYKKK